MSNRITQHDLEVLVNKINKATGSPEVSYIKNDEGKLVASIGHYHLSYAYGGVALDRMVSDGGGVTRISNTGFGTKKELYNFMIAYLDGISEGKAE